MFVQLSAYLFLQQFIGSTKLEHNPEHGYVAFSDQSDSMKVLYLSPIARHSSNKTISLPLDWNADTCALSVTLPDSSYPLVVTFALTAEKEHPKEQFQLAFPHFKFRDSGEVDFESENADDSSYKRTTGSLPMVPNYYSLLKLTCSRSLCPLLLANFPPSDWGNRG